MQRDILPIVEGCTVNTKYGAVKTDFMLFIAAGAFHIDKDRKLKGVTFYKSQNMRKF